MNVETIADLAKVRGWVSRLAHEDESLLGAVVRLLRCGSIIARIVCLTDALAWDALHICAGLQRCPLGWLAAA